MASGKFIPQTIQLTLSLLHCRYVSLNIQCWYLLNQEKQDMFSIRLNVFLSQGLSLTWKCQANIYHCLAWLCIIALLGSWGLDSEPDKRHFCTQASSIVFTLGTYSSYLTKLLRNFLLVAVVPLDQLDFFVLLAAVYPRLKWVSTGI